MQSPAVLLHAAWIDSGQPLPTHCALHGEPATSPRKLRILTPAPSWIFVLLVVGVLPFLIANHVLRQRVTAAAWPFCDRCRRERLVRFAKGLTVLAVGVVLFVVAIWVIDGGLDATSELSGTAQLVAVPGFLAVLIGLVLTRRALWRHVAGAVLTADRQRVIVQPAQPAFAEQVPPQARAAIPVPPGMRPR